MARTINEEEYAVKRNEILDAAYRLVLTKGYLQMTIHDVQSALGISKGAFYHYFDSKQALLAGLIDRIRQEAEAVVLPIVEDPHLSAIEKLQGYFSVAQQWKSGRKAYLLQVLRMWYDDDNAVLRQKVNSTTIKGFSVLFTRIIQQGVEEGVFNTPFPDQAAGMVVALFQAFGETFAQAMLEQYANGLPPPRNGAAHNLPATVAAYNQAVERILGAPPGSLHLIDPETLQEWLEVAQVIDQGR